MLSKKGLATAISQPPLNKINRTGAPLYHEVAADSGDASKLRQRYKNETISTNWAQNRTKIARAATPGLPARKTDSPLHAKG